MGIGSNHLLLNHSHNLQSDGSLMTEKTLQMHLEDYKKQIIESILFYEIHIDEPRDESYNAGLFKAIEAVKETEYVTR